jgi:hypothetical protein
MLRRPVAVAFLRGILIHVVSRINLRRIRWAQHVVYMGEKRNAYKVLVGKLKERDH